MRSLDQVRAAAAYAAVAEARGEAVDLARRLPDMLRINGLLATWAFLLTKEAKNTPTPLPALLVHLRSRPELDVDQEGDIRSAFLDWVSGARGSKKGVEGPALRALTAEALAFAGWLKRAAEAQVTETEMQEQPSDG